MDKTFINKHIKNKQILLFWNEQNINICELLFSNKNDISIISYRKDDELLSNYTKLIAFFGANIECNTFNEQYDTNNLHFNFSSLIKTFLFFIKKCIYCIKHKSYSKIRRNFSNYHFTNQEINLMAKISKYAKTHNENTIVFNNINFANELDLTFFKKIIESDFLRKYANQIKFIFISSSSKLNNIDLRDLDIHNCIEIKLSENELCEYIKNTYKNLHVSDEKLKQYLKLCHNDFGLINSIINSSENIKLDNAEHDELLQLEHIIFTTLERNQELNVLEIAAVIGLSFDINMLKSISELELYDLVERLKSAYDFGFLTKVDSYNYEFISNFIRNTVYKHGGANVLWHKKYAEEINQIAPNEHALIARHYHLGGELELSLYQYWAYILVAAIDNRIIADKSTLVDIENMIHSNIVWEASFSYIRNMLNKYLKNQLSKAEIIDCFQDNFTPNKTFDVINTYTKLTLLYAGKYTNTNKEFHLLGQKLEKSYIFLKQKRLLGLQIRCALYIIDIYSYRLNEFDKARKMQKELDCITQNLLQNLGNNSLLLCNNTLVLKIVRKTSVLFNAEIAYSKTKNLLSVCKEYQNTIDEVELYKFFNDHLGYSLYAGEFADVSEEIIGKITNMISFSREMNFPKTYKIRMNYFLYNLFKGNLAKPEIENFLLTEIKTANSTSSMYRYDLASVAMLCSDFNFAEKILLELYEDLKRNSTCFYHYSYNSNLASLYILKGNYEKAKFYNDKVINTDFDWFDDFIEIMKFRAKKMADFIAEGASFTPLTLFNCFSDIPIIISKTWSFLGKGILFSELMFYRE